MQKHTKMLPPLEHYMKPTYYDVIYLQPSNGNTEARPLPSLSADLSEERGGKAMRPLPMLELGFNFDRFTSKY